ncbi:MAG TPA: ATP-binding protein [Stellaceae bacterium]|jgi:serine/threonine-protein kinase RsbW|nr:ATP-binding protein [Stellaceae bacterium]
MNGVLRLRVIEGELPRLVEFVEKFAECCELPDAERARLLIILEELFTNTVRYGYPEGASDGRIKVALAIMAGQIEIDFSDDGQPFDPLAQRSPEFGRPSSERMVGGLGLHIVRSLVDGARYRRDGDRNQLTLVRRLARANGG